VTSSGPAWLPVAALLLAILALVLAALLWRARGAAARLDRLLGDTAAARQASEAVDRRFDELRRAVSERVEGVERRVAEGQRSLTDHLGQSGRLLRDVGEKMGRIFEASQKIERLATDVTRLEDLLKPPKLRGALGETFLEQALAQALPPRSWRMQYSFGDSVVDAAIFIGERIVPVDSKFPLENFRRAREAPEETDRRKAARDFASDFRGHVNAIQSRYIRPEAGTVDFALMYVPAEAVYAEIVEEGRETSLADYALERRVVPVSPRLLFAYLSTVAMGLKGLELQQSARQIGEKLAELARLWDKVEEPFAKLGGHLSNTQKQYELASRALDRFGARLEGVSERAEEELEPAKSDFPTLPPS
jgi:DNA recombination protein RmuC